MNAKEAGPRLGRGLAALMGEQSTSPNETPLGVAELGVDRLAPGPFQPRGVVDADALAELTASVKARGILQPLLARPDPGDSSRYQIIAGERRWRAAQAAGLHSVPVLVRNLSDADAMAAALVENLQRQDLDPIEEAEGFRRLIEEFSMTQETLAAAIGKSRSHVANTLRLLNLPSPVIDDVKAGRLSAGHARALLAHSDPAAAAKIVQLRRLNVRQTEALAKPSEPGSGREPKSATDPETIALARELSEHLGLRTDITFNGKSGVVRLFYQTLDQLDGLVTLLNRR